jgi:hypothetical protein
MSKGCSAKQHALLLVLLFAGAASSEEAALRISTDPALPIALQRDGRNVFRVVGAKQLQLRVRAPIAGSLEDVTASCAVTPASPLVSIGPGTTLSLAASPEKTMAAVVVECGNAREIVGFELTASAE